MKWISIYLLDSNCASCFSFHFSLLIRVSYNHSIFLWIISSFISYAISSMNLSARSGVSMISRSFILYNMNRIDDKDDSCEIPTSMFISINIISLKRNCIIHFIRKFYTNLIICKGIHLCFILWISLLWCILLKTSIIFIKTIMNISPCFHALYIFSDNIIIVSSVMCCGYALKWFVGSRSCVSMR